jgi:hypothetical protein
MLECGINEDADSFPGMPQAVSFCQDLRVTSRSILCGLRYTEELTFKEIGHRLQMREGTVRTYFRRARPLLCSFLLAQEPWGR